MQARQFDAISRDMTTSGASRRTLLKVLVGGAIAGGLALRPRLGSAKLACKEQVLETCREVADPHERKECRAACYRVLCLNQQGSCPPG